MIRNLQTRISTLSLRSSGSDDSDSPLAPEQPQSGSNVPENILAFRTISTLLAQVQDGTTFSDGRVKIDDDAIRNELRLLNALATIMVREHEVVAVTKKADGKPGALEVIACVHLTNDTDELTPTHTDTQKKSLGGQIWELFVTPNARKHDGEHSNSPNANTNSPTADSLFPSSNVPSIVDPADRIPFELKDGGLRAIETYIGPDLHKETFDIYVWMLSVLLMESKTNTALLLRFVTAAAYKKMHRRMTNATLSKPIADSLRNVSTFDFVDFSENIPNPVQARSDRILLCDILPSFQRLLPLPIPNLLRQASAARAGDPYELYTKDTCMEFHIVLCKAIEVFEASLSLIKSETRDSDFSARLRHVLVFGEALLELAKSSAIEKHLKTIEKLLADHRRDKAADVKLESLLHWCEKEEEGDRERDSELDSVQPYAVHDGNSPQPLWRSYRDWLRLLVAHFDAVSILTGYIRGPNFPFNNIHIKILAPSRSSCEMLSWEKLLLSKHFPSDGGRFQAQPDMLSNRDIVDFLTKWSKRNTASTGKHNSIAIKVVIRTTCRLLQLESSAVIPDAKVKEIVRQLHHVNNIASPGSEEYLSDTKALIETLKNRKLADSKVLIYDILQRLRMLGDNAQLFGKLASLTALKGQGFTSGSEHCEACLAGFIALSYIPDSKLETYRQYKDILDEFRNAGPVVGVSKRCCPICQQLLNILTSRKLFFFVRGSHTNISACTLPQWLPKEVVDRLNMSFGRQLREELINIYRRPDLVRSRIKSADSQRLSADSVRGGDVLLGDGFRDGGGFRHESYSTWPPQ